MNKITFLQIPTHVSIPLCSVAISVHSSVLLQPSEAQVGTDLLDLEK